MAGKSSADERTARPNPLTGDRAAAMTVHGAGVGGGAATRPVRRREAILIALVVSVAVVHGCTAGWAARDWQALADSAAMPPRMTMVRVRELAMSAPAAPTPMTNSVKVAPTPRRRSAPFVGKSAAAGGPVDAAASSAKGDATTERLAQAAAAAASADAAAAMAASAASAGSGSASASAASAPDAVITVADATSFASGDAAGASASAMTQPGPLTSATPVLSASAASAAGPTTALPTTAPADGFAWPQSTRVSYRLSGNYRGEVRGTAQVEWLLRGADYQMHMDITIGLPFAPLLDRHLASAGRVGTDGLVPERFDEDSKRAFQDRWRLSMRFAPDGISVGEQRRYDRVPGVQDTVSQFGQLSWRFAQHPELLTPGTLVDVPLALPRHLDVWRYRVLEPETLQTPFGPVPTAHLMPTRPPGNGDLSAELWFAPALRYLPVRIRIAQDASTYVDLLIDRRPEIGDAAPAQ